MEKAGAIELFMPALCPAELWEQTGRIDDYGNALVKFPMIRGDREIRVVLGPTNEEVVTDLMAKQIKSYRQLPITVFQIQTKFRNEERPRFGVMRTSEFQRIMQLLIIVQIIIVKSDYPIQTRKR